MLTPRFIKENTSTMEEILAINQGAPPAYDDFLRASAAEGFEHTIPSMALAEIRVQEAEMQAYGGQVIREENRDPYGLHELIKQAENPVFIKEKDWNKDNPLYREGIAWQPDMTEIRARIYAEDYDERMRRRELIARGKEEYGFFKGTVPGFFAGMLGTLPDPINLIPFGAGANLAKAGALSAIRMGAISGAAANLAVDAFVLPSLKERGDDVGFANLALDMVFGALLCGALGGAGYGLSRLAGRGKTPEASETPFTPTETARMNMHGKDRQIALDAFEDAALSVSRGEAVDVGRVLEGTTTINKAQVEALVQALENAEFTDVNFGRLRADYKEALNAIRTEEGVPLIQGDDLIIPANVVKKLYEKRMLQEGLSADRVAEILLNVFHREADFASSTRYRNIQAIVSLRQELADIGFISINPKTGETVIKTSFIVDTKKLHQKLKRAGSSENTGSEIYPGEAQHLPSGDDDISPPFAAPRLSALQGEKNIYHVTNEVNPFAVENPEPFAPAHPLSEASAAHLEDLGIDRQSGLSNEEILVRDLAAEGRIPEEQMTGLEEAAQAEARLKQVEEGGNQVLECVLEAID
jgi:hypothetical protein